MIKLGKLYDLGEKNPLHTDSEVTTADLMPGDGFYLGGMTLAEWRAASPRDRDPHDYWRHCLSEFYFRDWFEKRPPISIKFPGGHTHWIDQTSSNGPGWVVSGEWPMLTMSPSIVLPNYHGFLRNGEFTPDLDAATRA